MAFFAQRAHLQPDIAAWMAEHTTGEVLELAAAFRIPHAPIGNGATIPGTDHFVARRSIVANPRDGVAEPDRPYRFAPPLLASPRPAPRLGEDTGNAADPDAEVGRHHVVEPAHVPDRSIRVALAVRIRVGRSTRPAPRRDRPAPLAEGKVGTAGREFR